MDAGITVQSVEEAVTIFYRSDAERQKIAHDWLIKAQLGPQAWSFVWELMQLNKSADVQFFGATTLHTKLSRHWHEIPKENREELRQKLFQSIVLYAAGPKVVLSRLCICLSAFVVHMLQEHPAAIQDLVNTFQCQQMPNVNEDTQTVIFMDILCGIPFEVNGIYTSVQRAAIIIEINKHVPSVLSLALQKFTAKIDQPLTEEEMTTLLYVVKCAEAWLKNANYSLDDGKPFIDVLIKMTTQCYFNQMDSDGCLTYEANELAEYCVKTLTTMMTQPDAHRYPNAALEIMTVMVEQLSRITTAECKESNQNEDIVYIIYTLFVAASETHSNLIIAGVIGTTPAHQKLFMMLVDEILNCTNKPGIYPLEESCSSLAMGFWYMLQEEVLSNDSISSVREKAIETITPLYEHLARILVQKAQQPDDTALDQWCSEDLEAFRCYRQDISDTLLYCIEVLSTNLIRILLEYFEECISLCQRDARQWTILEACMYAIYSIAEHIEPDEQTYVPKFMMLLGSLPYNDWNDKVLATALDSIGAYGEWLKDNPDFVDKSMQVILYGLNSTATTQATFALKDLCRECQLKLKPYADQLLQACKQTISNGHLVQADELRVMYCIGRLMSTLTPPIVLQWLDIFISPHLAELQTITNSKECNDSNRVRTVFLMNVVGTLFSSLNTDLKINTEKAQDNQTKSMKQPVLLVMEQSLNLFNEMAILWANHFDVMEALSCGLKSAIVNLVDDFRSMLPAYCPLVAHLLGTACTAHAIDIAKKSILLFSKDEDYQHLMCRLKHEVINRVVYIIDNTPLPELSHRTDVLEAYFNFVAILAKKMPQSLVDEGIDCDKMIEHAKISLLMPEITVSKHSIMFLQNFITQSRVYARAVNAILVKGEQLVHTTLMVIGVYAQRNNVELYADILLALNKKYPNEFCTWMKMLDTEGFPSPSVGLAEKQNFARAMIRERTNKRLVQNLIRDFAARCRDILIQVP